MIDRQVTESPLALGMGRHFHFQSGDCLALPSEQWEEGVVASGRVFKSWQVTFTRPLPCGAHRDEATWRGWSRRQGRLNGCVERIARGHHPSCVRLSVHGKGLPRCLRGKEPTCQSRRHGFPGSGSSPGGRHSNPLQCSCLETPVDRGAWWATARSQKWQTRLSD